MERGDACHFWHSLALTGCRGNLILLLQYLTLLARMNTWLERRKEKEVKRWFVFFLPLVFLDWNKQQNLTSFLSNIRTQCWILKSDNVKLAFSYCRCEKIDEMHSCMTGLINIFVKLKHLYLFIFYKAFYKRAIVWFKVNVDKVNFSKKTTGGCTVSRCASIYRNDNII